MLLIPQLEPFLPWTLKHFDIIFYFILFYFNFDVNTCIVIACIDVINIFLCIGNMHIAFTDILWDM